ncbi:MAG: hypothetical protein AB1331_03250 [Bacillota bacterium]
MQETPDRQETIKCPSCGYQARPDQGRCPRCHSPLVVSGGCTSCAGCGRAASCPTRPAR